jgi:hypothetical protein
MRLCVVVDRNRKANYQCGDCQFARPTTRPPFCELFNSALTREPQPEGAPNRWELLRINECFAAQRMGEDPTCRNFGIEEDNPRP